MDDNSKIVGEQCTRETHHLMEKELVYRLLKLEF